MRDLVNAFLNYLAIEKGFSANTVSAYRNDLDQLAGFIEGIASAKGFKAEWLSVDRNLLINYIIDLKDRNYSSATVARKVAAVKSFFAFLVAERKIQNDPTENISSPKVNKSLPKPLS
jgi:integrase/recombinase XerD